MEYGTVKFFSKVRGYGFIIADAGDELFAHWTHILTGEPGQRNLLTDQRVTFVRKPSRTHEGKLNATKIEIIDEDTTPSTPKVGV